MSFASRNGMTEENNYQRANKGSLSPESRQGKRDQSEVQATTDGYSCVYCIRERALDNVDIE